MSLNREEEEALLRGGFNLDDSDFYEKQERLEQVYRWLQHKPKYFVKALYETVAIGASLFPFYFNRNMNLADVKMKRFSEARLGDTVNTWVLRKTLREVELYDLQQVIEDLDLDLEE